MEEILNIYDKVMELKIYIDSNDTSLIDKYKDAIDKHNKKLIENINYFDAGFDLYIATDQILSNPTNKVDYNIICSAKMYTDNGKIYNTGYYLYPRSSISKSCFRLANSTGIIDAGYRGHIIGMFDIMNFFTDLQIDKFDRLLQICAPSLVPIIVKLVDKFEDLGDPTSRGSGGFGSTGK